MIVKHIFSQNQHYWQAGAASVNQPDTQQQVLEAAGRPIQGFGVSFSELSYEALDKAQPRQAEALMADLFSPDACGFTIGRIPIGASDFALGWYSCDETEDDWALEHFSIKRDEERLIPLIRRAQQHCPDMVFFASPWSPPTWMKTRKVYNYGRLRQEPKVQKTYADYLVRFIREYRRQGIPITMLHIQNEPSADQKFPSCLWSGAAMRDFIRDYAGPALEKSGENARLWLGTINNPYSDYRGATPFEFFYDQFTHTVLADAQARKYIAGIGVQWGGKHQLDQIQASYPEIRMMQTESECGDGTNCWEQVEYLFHTMWHYFRHGIESYIYWNLALEQGAESTWGWRQNSLVSVDPGTGEVTRNPEFYLMKHFSHFVKPGARLCATAGHFAANTLVFANPDGSYAAVLLNGLDESRTIRLSLPQGSADVTVLPHALHSVLITP